MSDALISFASSEAELAAWCRSDAVLHLLCLEGELHFTYQGSRRVLQAAQYAILPFALLCLNPSAVPGTRFEAMLLSPDLVKKLPLASTYGVIGQLSLLQEPLLYMNEAQFARCLADIRRLKERLNDRTHCFYKEMLSHLLCAHILDLYDLHLKAHPEFNLSGRRGALMRRFIALLDSGLYRRERRPQAYAEKLCVSTHYLSEVCRDLSGRSAAYWIERYALQEILRLILGSELTLSQIAQELHFAQLPYFTRFVKKHLDQSPSALRRQGRLNAGSAPAVLTPC